MTLSFLMQAVGDQKQHGLSVVQKARGPSQVVSSTHLILPLIIMLDFHSYLSGGLE